MNFYNNEDAGDCHAMGAADASEFFGQPELKIGSEALLDGFTWVTVEDIDGSEFVVIDQDGGDHVVCESRLDPISS